MKHLSRLAAAIVFLAASSAVPAQDRGLLLSARAAAGPEVVIGRQYAVLIAIDRYREWAPLRKPVSDARAVRDVLARRYYIDEFIELYDEQATASGIRQLFSRLADTVGRTDSVLVYYAGHGCTDRFGTGFWIPVDGGLNADSQDRWIPNQQIRNFLSRMKARSVALVVDSCFSGDLLDLQRGSLPSVESGYFRNALRYTARQVLTSGASESVPDESEFARQFRSHLESGTDPWLDPLALYDRIRRGVTATLPLYGTLPGHEAGGSHLLFLKDAEPAPATGSASSGEGTLEIANAPFGARFLVAGAAGRAQGGSLVFAGLPAGAPLPFSVSVGGALELDAAYLRQEITVNAGSHETLEFPAGRLALPWLALGSTVQLLQQGSLAPLDVPLQSFDMQYRTPALAAGDYDVAVRGAYPYATRVTVWNGRTVELPGYRAAMLAALGAERDAVSGRLAARTAKAALGWVALGAGSAGLATAATLWFAGSRGGDPAADFPAALFSATLAVGVAGLGLAPMLWSGGPDPAALKRSMADLEASLEELGPE